MGVGPHANQIMKLNIRWQLAIVSVALALLPISIVGCIGYRTARVALQERISFNLQTLASQSDERLERLLLDRQQRERDRHERQLPPDVQA